MRAARIQLLHTPEDRPVRGLDARGLRMIRERGSILLGRSSECDVVASVEGQGGRRNCTIEHTRDGGYLLQHMGHSSPIAVFRGSAWIDMRDQHLFEDGDVFAPAPALRFAFRAETEKFAAARVRAREAWAEGDDLLVGKLLSSALSKPSNVWWSRDVLMLGRRALGGPSVVNRVLELATNPPEWPNSHELFDDVRKETLVVEKNGRSLELTMLLMTELVVKLVYNASDAPAPFDEDTGWWVPQIARELAMFYGTPMLLRDIEDALFCVV
jgi:hypothetical protein